MVSLTSKLLLTHCVSIFDLGGAQDGKIQQGSREEDWGKMSWCFHAAWLVGTHGSNTLTDELADDVQLLHSAPTVSIDREERNVPVHDLVTGDLQSVKVPPLWPALNFIGWDFILLRLGVNAV